MKTVDITAISIVVPVHNEAGNVDKLMKELANLIVDNVEFEFIFVDDGSDDETVETLLKIRQQEPRLRILQHQANYGQSVALRSGVKIAHYDWICTLDGDGQNDPADIPNLITCAKEVVSGNHPVLISGNRRRTRKDTFIRRLSSVVANNIRSRLLNDSTPDSGCGLKLINREGYLSLPYFNHMHRFFPSLVLRESGIVHSIHVNHRPRLAGKSHYGVLNRLWVGVVDILGVMWLQRRASNPSFKTDDS